MSISRSMALRLCGTTKRQRTIPVSIDGITFQQAAEVFFDPFLIVVDASEMKKREKQ